MTVRTERSRPSQGPLGSEEFSQFLTRGYDEASLRFFARVWRVPDQIDAVAAVASDSRCAQLDLEALAPVARALFGLLARRGGRLRGEILRRDLLLNGFGESEEVLRSLVLRGYLVPLPNPGEHDCNLDALLEHGAFLQRDMAILETTFDSLGEVEDVHSLQAPAWSTATADPHGGDLQSLELNILHLSALIRRDPLKLNKDGTPNRRSLGRVARGISMPGSPGEVAADLDLHDALQLDYLTFLVAVSRELQLLSERENTYRTDDQELTRFFHSDGAERDRRILDALQRIRFWNELDSARLAGPSSRTVDEEHFSQFESTGQPLIGARGFVFSVLRRAQFSDWVALNALAELCTQLDHQYLERTLAQLSHRPDPEEFIQAVLTRTLVWGGILQLGHAETGEALARLTPRGARALGLDHPIAEPLPGGSLIVQPNFEVMVFLDNSPITVLHELYRLGERKKLSDRVATFQLLAESVQRGYTLGADADSLLALLQKEGHTPVPEAVAFQLRDWERVHRRLTIHLGGAALLHPDPERFDLICGQLDHDLRGSDVSLIRLGPRDAFVTDASHPAVERAAASHRSLRLDALGAPPRCLHFVDPLVLMVDPYEWDIATSVELRKITDPLADESSPRALFFELNISKIQERFPENPLKEVSNFLDLRSPDGLPAAQALRLQAELRTPAKIHLQKNLTVLAFETIETAERFSALPEAPDIIARRLGPTTFVVFTEQEALLEEIIDELRLEKASQPFEISK